MAAVGLAWDVQRVPECIYREARAQSDVLTPGDTTEAEPAV
jgi:hypothetical protein